MRLWIARQFRRFGWTIAAIGCHVRGYHVSKFEDDEFPRGYCMSCLHRLGSWNLPDKDRKENFGKL